MYIIFFIIPASSYAGKWVQVEGWAVKLIINPNSLEDKLWSHLNINSDTNFKDRESYWYQYKTINDSEIYINALCKVSKPELLEEDFIVVFDGGSCFFQITYNFKTDKFYDLQVNSEA